MDNLLDMEKRTKQMYSLYKQHKVIHGEVMDVFMHK